MSTQARRVLAVTAGNSEGLVEQLHERVARTRAEVLVVAPAAPTPGRGAASGHEDRRPRLRRPVEDSVRRCVEQLRLSGFDAEGVVGDADPAQAVEDALALFDAEVIVIDAAFADRARRRFGLPIVPVHAAA